MMSEAYMNKLLGEMFKKISSKRRWIETIAYWVIHSSTGRVKKLNEFLSDQIKRIEKQGKKSEIYKLALSLQSKSKQVVKAQHETIYRIEKYVYEKFAYKPDKFNYGMSEYWAEFDEIMGKKADDCDGLNSLIYLLCRCAGIGTLYLFQALGDTDIDVDTNIDHYYGLFYDSPRNRWVKLDATYKPEIKPIYKKSTWIPGKLKMYSIPEFIFNEEGIWKFK